MLAGFLGPRCRAVSALGFWPFTAAQSSRPNFRQQPELAAESDYVSQLQEQLQQQSGAGGRGESWPSAAYAGAAYAGGGAPAGAARPFAGAGERRPPAAGPAPPGAGERLQAMQREAELLDAARLREEEPAAEQVPRVEVPMHSEAEAGALGQQLAQQQQEAAALRQRLAQQQEEATKLQLELAETSAKDAQKIGALQSKNAELQRELAQVVLKDSQQLHSSMQAAQALRGEAERQRAEDERRLARAAEMLKGRDAVLAKAVSLLRAAATRSASLEASVAKATESATTGVVLPWPDLMQRCEETCFAIWQVDACCTGPSGFTADRWPSGCAEATKVARGLLQSPASCSEAEKASLLQDGVATVLGGPRGEAPAH